MNPPMTPPKSDIATLLFDWGSVSREGSESRLGILSRGHGSDANSQSPALVLKQSVGRAAPSGGQGSTSSSIVRNNPRARRGGTQMDYLLGFAVEVAIGFSDALQPFIQAAISNTDLARGSSQWLNSEKSLCCPHECDSGVVSLRKARVIAELQLAQPSNHQEHEIDELSHEEKELRRPPSPFVLLDADASRPELPTDARVIPVIRVP